MNRDRTENSAAGLPTWVNSYDVLLTTGVENDPPCFAPGNHVGNHRLRVLLTFFRQRYLQADLFGHEEDCSSIAEEVAETVSSKCVPNGRFYEQGQDEKWYQLDSYSPYTIGIIRELLKNDPEDTCLFERSPKRPRLTGFELLYKAARKELPNAPQELVSSTEPFDVICGSKTVLEGCEHTGNNRLKVLLDIRMKTYKASSPEEKHTIAEEIVDSCGSFLREDEQSDKYRVLSKSSAVTCVQNAFDTANVASSVQKQVREAEVNKLVQRRIRKAILDKLEARKHLLSAEHPPTKLNACKKYEFVSRAA